MTLQDVARAAGVSPATVSLVLRGSRTIPERTHELVRRHASALGYVYHRGAAGLRGAQSHIVALAVHDVTNPYFAVITAAIQQELGGTGRIMVLGDSGDDPARQAAFLQAAREYAVDGVLLSPAIGTGPELIAALRGWGLAPVLVSRRIEGAVVDEVLGDHAGGAAALTRVLLDAGHRRLAFLGGLKQVSTARERVAGFELALRERGLAPLAIAPCPSDRRAARDLALGLLARREPPTGLVCFNDVTAFGALLALQNLGLAAGKDVSVTGFDDIDEAALWRPGLTTARLDGEFIGKEAVRLLLRRLADPGAPVARVIAPAELRLRQTVGPPT